MDTQHCNSCNQTLPISQFNFKSKAQGKRQHYCITCARLKSKAHYTANKQKYIDRALAHNEKAITRNQDNILAYLATHPCLDCGETDPVCLDFDHQGDKKFNISDMVRHAYSWSTIQSEIDKCEIRCANCHRRRTAKAHGYYKSLLRQ